MKFGFLMENDKYSYARMVGFTVVVFYMIFAGRISWVTKTLPDIPPSLMLLAVMGYGIGKAGEILINGQNKVTLSNKDGG